jgi:peptidoglycan/xylan/chitin deacetylase (PgdA/CDA1 family)
VRRHKYIQAVMARGVLSKGLRSAVVRSARAPGAATLIRVLDRLVGNLPGAYAALTYHRVADPAAAPWLYPGLISATPAAFEEQMRVLSRDFRPISMHELLAAHYGKAPLPRRAVLVTFDDGYRDFAEHAWPVLSELGIPVTLFVPSSYPNSPGLSFWWDRLWAALTSLSEGAQLETPCGVLSVSSAAKRLEIARQLIDWHKRLPHDESMASVDAICEKSGTVAGERSSLSWDELRGLAADGVTLSPHSRTHPLLTRVPDSVMRAEIEGSRDDLLRQLNGVESAVARNVFAYPSGAHDERVRQAALNAGYELAFATARGVNVVGRSDPQRLRRINVGSRSNQTLVRAQIVLGTLRRRVGLT